MSAHNVHGHTLDAMPECLLEDVIDVGSITDRVDELREEREDATHDDDGNRNNVDWAEVAPEDAAELAALESLLEDLRGNGGDHQWEGDWYPQTLYRDDETFTDYIEELVTDCYSLNVPSFVEVDWKATADNCRVDYTETEIDGETYLYR